MLVTLSCAWYESFISPQTPSPPASFQEREVVKTRDEVDNLSHSTDFSSSDFRFDQISLEEGLSQSSVFAIYQDSFGYLWFGTQDGLNQYDGYSIEVYRPVSGNEQSLSASDIQSIYEDRAGMLWIGTNGWGLNRLNRETDQFTQYKNQSQDYFSLGGNIVNVIYEDAAGDLWIGTNGGLNKYNKVEDNFVRYRNVHDDPDSLSSNYVLSIFEDQDNSLWIGTSGGGLNKFDREAENFQRFKNIPGDPFSLSNNTVWSITEDRDGVLWIGTDGGLNQFLESSGRFVRYQNSPHDPNSISSNQVRSVFADCEGVIWVGTHGMGLNRFDKNSGKFQQIQSSPSDAGGLSDDFIWTIYEDKEGTLWVGTLGGGVNKLDQNSQPFRHISANDQYSGGLSDNMVWSIFEDRYGVLWVGTMGGGLNKFDNATGVWRYYQHNPNNPASISHDNVRAIGEDNRGDLWIGTDGGGLNKYNREKDTFIHYGHDPMDPNSLSDDEVLSIYKDRHGDLWVGTRDAGLNLYDYATDQFHHFTLTDNANSIYNNEIHSIYMDRKGTLWVGTVLGLNKINLKKGDFKHYHTNQDDPESLNQNIILTIFEDRTGTIWLGTHSGGLNKFDPEKEIFTRYNELDGLASNVVYGILEDDQGYLWLSTNNGISRFDPLNEQFKNFDVSNGLQSNEFNAGAYHEGKKGEMFFGGVNGFNSFSPEKIPEDNQYLPPIVLTSLTQGGEAAFPNENLESIGEFTFRWPDDYFEFEFSALSFVNPEENQYAYMLEGFDKQWNYVGSQRFGRYTNLPGGSYKLHIKGSNNDGIWNEQGLVLNVTFVPPFWETWLFRGLVVMIVVVGVVSGIRLRVRSIESRSRALEMQVQERTFEIERRQKVAEGLRDILVILNSDKSILESLDYIVCQSAELTNAAGAVIYRVIETSTPKIMAYCTNSQEQGQLPEKILVDWSDWIASQLIDGKPLVVSADEEPGGKRLESLQLIREIQSVLGIPLTLSGRIYGGFVLFFGEQRSFSEDEIQLGITFAEQAVLAIANAQLRDKAEQAAVSAERNRLARDLHDSAKQQAFAVSAQLGAAIALIEDDQVEAKQHLTEADRLAYEVRQELTDLIQELHPVGLDGRGLVPAINEYTFDWGKQYNIETEVLVEGERSISDETERALFRIIQGALSNISRHSQAKKADIKLVYDPDYIKLTIVDNGIGFDVNEYHQGLGLRSMRERVELLSGKFSLQSKIDEGTRIEIKFYG
jgi:signal transduction histidine kinase/ligand-binding sensor domain-containing protein